jgi:hypothetical protein
MSRNSFGLLSKQQYLALVIFILLLGGIGGGIYAIIKSRSNKSSEGPKKYLRAHL